MKGTQGGYDLTQGSMLGHVISFSIPMLLGNMLQALYNTVDSIWVGRFLGPRPSGRYRSASHNICLNSLVMGITIGSTVLIAQYRCKTDKMVKRVINNTLVLLMAAASRHGGITSTNTSKADKHPDEIMAMAAEYLNIFLLGLIFMFGYNAVSAIKGPGRPRTRFVPCYIHCHNIVLTRY